VREEEDQLFAGAVGALPLPWRISINC
jgi:hypothetical protein